MSSHQFCSCKECTCELTVSEINIGTTATPQLEDDRRLAHWQNVLQSRKKLHKKLGRRLGRQPGELLMNITEESRGIREEKEVIDAASIPYPPDKYLGCPDFFTFPAELSNKCNPAGVHYYVQKTLKEKCKLPKIEHVGIPREIMKEKDILPRTR